MSFGVDTLGGLIEKLKQLVNDTQNHYESFFDSTQLYKQGKMDDKDYFSKMGEYLVSSSALNFLACRIILELKITLDKGASKAGSMHSPSHHSGSIENRGDAMDNSNRSIVDGAGGRSSAGGPGSSSSSDGSHTGFGVDSFISSGGNTGPVNNEYDLPMPQEAPTFKPIDIPIPKQNSGSKEKKNCIVCAGVIPKYAKFCNKCGRSQ